MVFMHSPASQHGVAPPTPPPSPCYEGFGRHPRDEELFDSYGSSVETTTIDGDNSVSAEVPEDRNYATGVALHVKVVTQAFERDGVVLGADTLSNDGDPWPPPPIFQETGCELIDAEYTLVRVALEGHETVNLDEMAQDLDETVGSVDAHPPSLVQVSDRSVPPTLVPVRRHPGRVPGH
ncbi:hypothetical protein LTR67_008410 [Exophiala xenobiotica]